MLKASVYKFELFDTDSENLNMSNRNPFLFLMTAC